jgi:hypothetical protein
MLCLCLAAGACEITGPCTTEAVPGLAVTVQDSASNHIPEPRDSVSVIAVDGAFSDSVRALLLPPDELAAFLAYERAGTYRVEVKVRGYRTWTRSNVVVTRDACHVRTFRLTALLQRT